VKEESKVKGSRAEAKEIWSPDQAGDDRRRKISQSLRSFEMTREGIAYSIYPNALQA
jgi:hypothetical protein